MHGYQQQIVKADDLKEYEKYSYDRLIPADNMSMSDAMTNDEAMVRFVSYLRQTEGQYLIMLGVEDDSGRAVAVKLPFLHRWKADYKKRLLAKMYRMNEWYRRNKSPVSMLTLTTVQRGLTIPDQLILLKESFNLLKKMMRKHIGKNEYVWVLEPHKSGYAHIHMLWFGQLTVEQQDMIRDLWVGKYGAGGYKDAVQFVVKSTQRSLKSAGAYFFKYLAKTLMDAVDTGYMLLSAWVREMSRRGSSWSGVRFWGASAMLTRVMAYIPRLEHVAMSWFKSMIGDGASGLYVMWIDKGAQVVGFGGKTHEERWYDQYEKQHREDLAVFAQLGL